MKYIDEILIVTNTVDPTIEDRTNMIKKEDYNG